MLDNSNTTIAQEEDGSVGSPVSTRGKIGPDLQDFEETTCL
jgi:hypothetical protein